MKNTILTIVAFFKFLGALFVKWFLPLPYPDELEEESGFDFDEDEKLNQIEDSNPKESEELIGFEDEMPPIVNHKSQILQDLALSNSKTSRQIANSLDMKQQDCRDILDELIDEGSIHPGEKNDWYNINSEIREKHLKEDFRLKEIVEILIELVFRENFYKLIHQMLEKYPLQVIPTEEYLTFRYKGRHALNMLFYKNSITFELRGKYEDQFIEKIHLNNGINIESSDTMTSFDWHPSMPSNIVIKLLKEALQAKFDAKESAKTEEVSVTKE